MWLQGKRRIGSFLAGGNGSTTVFSLEELSPIWTSWPSCEWIRYFQSCILIPRAPSPPSRPERNKCAGRRSVSFEPCRVQETARVLVLGVMHGLNLPIIMGLVKPLKEKSCMVSLKAPWTGDANLTFGSNLKIENRIKVIFLQIINHKDCKPKHSLIQYYFEYVFFYYSMQKVSCLQKQNPTTP